MLAVRGIYDGKSIRALPSERLPEITGSVRVAIIFLENVIDEPARRRQIETARRMRLRRAQMHPLRERIKDLIEEGRER
jgi:hypothetical protein